jgi:hypothetical protein
VTDLLTLCFSACSFLTSPAFCLCTSFGFSLRTTSLFDTHALLNILCLQGLAGGAGGSLRTWGRDGGRRYGRCRVRSLDTSGLRVFALRATRFNSPGGLLYVPYIDRYEYLDGLRLRTWCTQVQAPQQEK